MRTITILLFTATVAALSSCSKRSNPGPINLPGNATAYVAGAAGDTAVYYINGKEYALTSGNTPAAANSIAISGSNIYIAGYESNGKHTAAKYWKNGTATTLSDTSLNAAATAIAVSGSDVYVAGWIAQGSTNAAALWKNGVLTQLTYTGHNGIANALCLSGTDVYVAGLDSVAGNVTACYWKNGALNSLPDSLSYAVAKGIAVSGSDVYVVGWDHTTNNYVYNPRLWKNGLAVPLEVANAHSFFYAIATSIYMVGDTTYIGGLDDYQSVYWKNSTENQIADGYQVNAIAVNNGNIYVAGLGAGSAGYNSATFWRDGISFILDASNSSANAIAVTN